MYLQKIEWLFFPAIFLMKRLTFIKKSVLLVVVVLLATLAITGDLYTFLKHDIKIKQQELVGLNLLPPLIKTIQRLQEHRGISSAELGGSSGFETLRLFKLKSMKNAFSVLEHSLPTRIRKEESWQKIIRQWNLILTKGIQWSQEDSFSAHSLLIKQLQTLVWQISDEYHLINISDRATYYLLNTALYKLLPAQEILGQLRGFGAGILAKKQSTEKQRTKITVLIAQINATIKSLQFNLYKTASYNPLLKKRLLSASQKILTDSESISTQVQFNIIKNHYLITTKVFFNFATEAINNLYKILNQVLIPTTRQLIQQRLSSIETTYDITLTITIMVFLAILYFSIGVYLSTINSIRTISRATLRFAKGDFSQRIQLNSEDEFKYLSISFNTMANQLSQLIRDEKKDKAYIQAIIESSQDAQIQMDAQGRIIGWSHQAELIFGWLRSEIIGKSVHKMIIPLRFRNQHTQGLNKFILTGKSTILNKITEISALHHDGHEFPIELAITSIKIEGGYEFNAFIRDISERKKHERGEQTRHHVLELLMSTAPLTAILEFLLKMVERENPSIKCSILLLDKEGKHLLMGVAPSLPDFYNDAVHGLEIGEGIGSCGAAAFTRKRVIVENIRTHPYWRPYKEIAAKANLASCWSEPIIGTQDKLLGTFATYHDKPATPTEEDFKLIHFTSQLAAIAIERSQINEQLSLSFKIFNDTHEGISITDTNATIIDVNPAFCKITGYHRDEVIGQNPRILTSGKQDSEFYTTMWKAIKEQDYWQGELWNKKKEGTLYAQRLTISALKDSEGKTLNYVGLFSDVTQGKRQQEKLNLMAHYDVLTQLPNRVLFKDRFYQALAHSKRTSTQLAVCFLDLDNFKPVNDNYGHDMGDQLLIEVAKRIKAHIREEDTVSRQGGDEFAILLGDIKSVAQCEQTLQRIHYSLEQPYIIDEVSLKISASSGVTLFPSDKNDIDTLLRHADHAMYQSKQSGRNNYHIFNAEKN